MLAAAEGGSNTEIAARLRLARSTVTTWRNRFAEHRLDGLLDEPRLDRTQPVFPMLPGTPARASHDYVRHGTSSLYAALDVATGKVIGSLHAAAPGGRVRQVPP